MATTRTSKQGLDDLCRNRPEAELGDGTCSLIARLTGGFFIPWKLAAISACMAAPGPENCALALARPKPVRQSNRERMKRGGQRRPGLRQARWPLVGSPGGTG